LPGLEIIINKTKPVELEENNPVITIKEDETKPYDPSVP